MNARYKHNKYEQMNATGKMHKTNNLIYIFTYGPGPGSFFLYLLLTGLTILLLLQPFGRAIYLPDGNPFITYGSHLRFKVPGRLRAGRLSLFLIRDNYIYYTYIY